MGSLPNLRSLSNDPNTTYKYELCDPDECGSSLKQNSCRTFVKQHHRSPANSQNEVYRLKVNHFPNLDAKNLSKNHTYHHRICHTRNCGSQYNYNMQNTGVNWDDYKLQLAAYSPISSRSSRSNVTSGANAALYNLNHPYNRRRDSLSR